MLFAPFPMSLTPHERLKIPLSRFFKCNFPSLHHSGKSGAMGLDKYIGSRVLFIFCLLTWKSTATRKGTMIQILRVTVPDVTSIFSFKIKLEEHVCSAHFVWFLTKYYLLGYPPNAVRDKHDVEWKLFWYSSGDLNIIRTLTRNWTRHSDPGRYYFLVLKVPPISTPVSASCYCCRPWWN